MSFKSLIVAVLTVGLTQMSHAANLVTNGGFETGDFTGWTQTGNSAFNGVQCPGPGPTVQSGNCSAFFGPVGSTGGISQTLNVAPDSDYLIDFWFLPDGGNPSSFSVSFDGVQLLSLTNPPASAVFTHLALAGHSDAGDSTAVLAFSFRDDPGFLFLDTVDVTVPEPMTLAMFGLGVAALGLRRRHRLA